MALTILPYNDRSPVKSKQKAEAFSQAVQTGIGAYGKYQSESLKKGEAKELREKENAALLKQGYDLQDIESSDIRKQIISNVDNEKRQKRQSEIKQDELIRKAEKEKEEKIAPFEGALKTIDEMRNLGKAGNLGVGSGISELWSSKTRKSRAKYTQLGKSLIQFASDIPIRNKAEFEVMAHDLYNPSLTDAAREGILDAMQERIQEALNSLSPNQQQNQQQQGQQPQQQQQRPPLESFMR
jgi:hypothetical protein